MASDNGGSQGDLAVSTYRYPTGWFCVGWSDELKAQDVKKLHYFGQELVCFRGESGKVYVLDAYCLHLGGHLGVGGRVEGERIVCPWHEWHWNGDGTHALIPYSKQKNKPHLRIASWPVRDWNGMILVWHDRHRRLPHWEPPPVPEAESDEFYPLHPHTRLVKQVKVHVQMIMENAADPYHIPPVHHGHRPETTSFQLEGDRLHATIKTTYGAGKKSTWLTPDGPLEAHITYDTYGLGIGFVRFPSNVLEAVQITSHTPIDEESTAYWYMLAARREPGDTGEMPQGRAARFLKAQQNLIQQDFSIWENMKYLETPSFAPEEAEHYAAFRRWAQHFYPEPSPEQEA